MRTLAVTAFIVCLCTVGAAALLAWTRDGFTLREFADWVLDRDDLQTIAEAQRYRRALGRTTHPSNERDHP